jgi:hypothetical protein
MLVSDANKKRRAYAWMVSQIMEIKENAARERLLVIDREQPTLKANYETYLRLYNLHIKPLMPAVHRYFNNINEQKKIEHFLAAQTTYAENHPAIQKLPYAGKSAVGRKPKEKSLDEKQASDVMAQLKALDPKVFAELLKKVGGK